MENVHWKRPKIESHVLYGLPHKCASISTKIELVLRIVTDDQGSQCRQTAAKLRMILMTLLSGLMAWLLFAAHSKSLWQSPCSVRSSWRWQAVMLQCCNCPCRSRRWNTPLPVSDRRVWGLVFQALESRHYLVVHRIVPLFQKVRCHGHHLHHLAQRVWILQAVPLERLNLLRILVN